MTKITTITIPLIAFIAIGMSFAYADHPLTHGFDEHSCFSFYIPEVNKYTTNCSWSYQPNETERKQRAQSQASE